MKPGVLLGSVVFAIAGVLIFWISFLVIDKLTPYNLWEEIVEKQNQALALVVAAMSLGIGIIVAAASIVRNAPDFLTQAAARTVQAPWLVANMHIEKPLFDKPGPPPSWDKVMYGDAQTAPGLGYVDAMHQSLQPVPGATVLTHYRAPGNVAGGPAKGRELLLQKPWTQWRDDILRESSVAHPDLPRKTARLDITRYGHAMAIPVPERQGRVGQVPSAWGRIRFAHSDWAGYSVFEEAFSLGHLAGDGLA